MENYHSAPGRLAIRQVDSGGGNGIIRCRDAHDPTACLDNIKRRLVWTLLGRPVPMKATARSAAARVRQATIVRRCPSVTSRRPSVWPTRPAPISARVIACSDRLHTVSPGSEPAPRHHIVHGRRARGKPISRWPGSGEFFDVTPMYGDREEAERHGAIYRGSGVRTPQPLWEGVLQAHHGYRSWL